MNQAEQVIYTVSLDPGDIAYGPRVDVLEGGGVRMSEGGHVVVDKQDKTPPKTAVSTIAGSLAAMILEEHVRNGGTIEIPSLGITITQDNLRGPAPDDKKKDTAV